MRKHFFEYSLMKKTIIFLSCTFLLFSCKRPKEQIGPEYKVPGKNFALITPLKGAFPTVDFSTGQLESFDALFSQQVTWKLTLTGVSSGAVKTFQGFSNKLDGINTLWNGNHESMYFFRSNEKVSAQLTFLGSQLTFRDTVQIVGARKWDIPNKIVTAINFDNSKFDYAFYDGPADLFPTYKVTYPVKSGVKSDMETATNNQIENVIRDVNGDTIKWERTGSVEGNSLYRFRGQDGIYTGAGYSDYFIGGAGFAKANYFGLDKNPSNVFFNLYIYGTGDPNAKLVINFDEDDDGNKIADNGTMAENYVLYEDEYAWEIPVSWRGWKMMSVKYSDLKLSADGLKSVRGNKILEPNKIAKIGFVLITLAKGGATSVIFDFATFTMNKPFNPND